MREAFFHFFSLLMDALYDMGTYCIEARIVRGKARIGEAGTGDQGFMVCIQKKNAHVRTIEGNVTQTQQRYGLQ